MTTLNYLKTFRKRWALSQDELGALLGSGSDLKRCSIYRLEEGARSPTIRAALACEIIFDVPAGRLFPDLFSEIESVVVGRAERMHRALEGQTDEKANRKRELLEGMMERAKRRGR
jgi:transcriptional regulator with XRE-family HTH domain